MLSRNHPAEPVEVAAVTILNLNWISVWVVISGILDRFVEEETQPLTASPPKTEIVLEAGVPETSRSPIEIECE